MSKFSKEQATEEYKYAYDAWEKAKKEYEEIITQYICLEPIVNGEPIPNPPKVIDIRGYREIKRTSREIDGAKQRMDKAALRLYDAYYKG